MYCTYIGIYLINHLLVFVSVPRVEVERLLISGARMDESVDAWSTYLSIMGTHAKPATVTLMYMHAVFVFLGLS